MTYTFKLARRLAVSRNFGMLPVLLLFAGCTGGDATAPDNSPVDVPGSGIYAWRPRESTPVALLVSPSSVIVETNQLLQFRARGRNRAGDEVVAPVTWSTTGGAILPDGRFSAASVGTYQVTGRTRTREGTEMVQTSTINVVRRQAKIKSVVVTPGMATLNPGVSQTFAAIGRLPSGDTVPVGVIWSAKGGTIDAGGLYVAGDSAGTFKVIATKNASTLADTATITISAPPSPPPPTDSVITPPTIPVEPVPPAPDTTPTPPPPAPVLAQVALLPGSATLAPGTTKQFSAYGRTTAGDSVAVSVVFAATGGTVTPAGLYTAGPSAGSFRVIASVAGLADTSTVTVTVPLGSGTSVGVPFGPFQGWSDVTLKANMDLFNVSMDATTASNILPRITEARTRGSHLMPAMTGGAHAAYLTNGVFDKTKWTARLQTFNTSAIRQAVAVAVADGTIIGANVMDEPFHPSWGGTMTKVRVDSMCADYKALFPTLPVGPTHDDDDFEPTKSYRVCDFITSQYRKSKGDVNTFREHGLALARRDGHAIAFSMNIMDGGDPDVIGAWDCVGTGGMGTYGNKCRMTAAQVKAFGLALLPAGCAALMWRWDATFMSDAGNQASFRAIADSLSRVTRKSCRRP